MRRLSRIEVSNFFQPLQFHLEPPGLLIKLCFLRLLLPLLALAVHGENVGPVFQPIIHIHLWSNFLGPTSKTTSTLPLS